MGRMQGYGRLGIIGKDLYLAGGLLAACGFVYVRTLCPTVYVEGTGELISASHFLGIAHPTGYPLFCLVARLLSAFVPAGSVAYRVNLASALFGALTVGVVYLLLARLLRHRAAALGASLFFGFSRTFWSQAVLAEVYTLNVLFLSSLLLLLVLWRDTGEVRYLLLVAYGYGLSLTNHLTMALFGPGILAFVLIGLKRVASCELRVTGWGRASGPLLVMVPFFLLGLTPYLYLPLRAAAQPAFVWTELATLRDILAHGTGRMYRSYVFAFPWRLALGRNLVEYAKILSGQFPIYLVWIPALGLLANARRDRRMFLVLGATFSLYVLYGITYDMDLPEIDVFYLPSFLVAALWAGFGLDLLLDRVDERVPWNRLALALGGLIAIVLPAMVLAGNWDRNDLSGNRIPYEYGMDILSGLGRNAVLFTEGDDASFILDYLQMVERVRPDVSVYHRGGEVSAGIYGPSFRRLSFPARARKRREVETDLIARGHRPVYYVFRAGVSLPSGYVLVPEGLCYRAVRAPGSLDGAFWERRDPDPLAKRSMHKDGWVRKILANYYFSRAEFRVAAGDSARGFEDYDKAGELAFDAWVIHHNLATVYRAAGRWDRARGELEKVVLLNPLMADGHYRLGLLHAHFGEQDRAIGAYRRAIELRPSHRHALHRLGVAYAAKGEYEVARMWWRRTLQVDPGYRAAREGLHMLDSMGE